MCACRAHDVLALPRVLEGFALKLPGYFWNNDEGFAVRRGLSFGALGAVLAALLFTPLGVGVGNWISMVDRNGFFVPEESSVWTFRETEMDTGSGGYWLYGEDEEAFFAASSVGGYEAYSRITRRAASEVDGFDPLDWETWRHYSQAPCGDLLELFAAPVEGLEFLSCVRPKTAQTVVRARYRVAGAQAAEVEAALVARFGMGGLVWACCGYESRGYGGFNHEELTGLHPFLMGSVSMAGSGEDGQEMPVVEYGEIDYFYVTVEISLV